MDASEGSNAPADDAVIQLLARLDAAEARLRAHAQSPTPTGLSDPDDGAEERWEAGQIWAHIAEFVPYWHRQAQAVLSAPEGQPAAFGRTKSDESRISAIERDRNEPPAALMARVTNALAELRTFLRELPPEAWSRTGLHPVRGEVPVSLIVEKFEVDHLEEHADQLDSLAGPEVQPT